MVCKQGTGFALVQVQADMQDGIEDSLQKTMLQGEDWFLQGTTTHMLVNAIISYFRALTGSHHCYSPGIAGRRKPVSHR